MRPGLPKPRLLLLSRSEEGLIPLVIGPTRYNCIAQHARNYADLDAMTMTPVIEVHNLSRRFGELEALVSLDLEVNKGEVFGLLGHNGAGKTTTVRLLNGVLRPDRGQLSVLGLDPVTQGEQLRARTGVLTETPSVDARLTGRENLVVFARLYGIPEGSVRERTARLLDQFGLLDRADDRVSGYSRGMQQRLALARALVHDPEMLFLDEPTAALDPVATRQVHHLISGLRLEGRTIVICTHNLVEAQRLCDRVAILEHGRVMIQGRVRELSELVRGSGSLEIEVGLDELDRAQGILVSGLPGSEIRQERNLLICNGIPWDDIPGAVKLLTSSGVRVYAVRPEEPSLEDVYFQVHDNPGE